MPPGAKLFIGRGNLTSLLMLPWTLGLVSEREGTLPRSPLQLLVKDITYNVQT